MEREDDAAGADVDAGGGRGDRGADDRRIGVEAAERMEVALGRPDRGEVLAIGEAPRLRAADDSGRRALRLRRWRSRTG